MLNESRLFSFFDNNHNFTVHFLEGQKLIHDIAVIHKLEKEGFLFYRDILLSFQPMISFLKPREGFGIYIDSSSPQFSFKIETNESGLTRSLIMPESFSLFPETISGQCRISKILPENPTPYTSIIEVNNARIDQIANEILTSSYQMNATVSLANSSDQSMLISKLPSVGGEKTKIKKEYSLEDYQNEYADKFQTIYNKALNNENDIIKCFTDLNFQYLSSKEVKFHCGCSKDRFIVSILSLQNSSIEDVFEDESEISVRCDYCGKNYEITKDEVNKAFN